MHSCLGLENRKTKQNLKTKLKRVTGNDFVLRIGVVTGLF